MIINLSWDDFKQVLSIPGIVIRYIDRTDTYIAWAFDNVVPFQCIINKNGGSEQIDFDDNYKAAANQMLIQGVQTRGERTDIDLKLFSMKADVNTSTGVAVASIKIPGVFANGDYRFIGGGEAFFDKADLLDRANTVSIVDKDNILGYGADFVVKTYHDDQADEENQGWWIGIDNYNVAGNTSYIEIKPMGFYGQVPSELYLEIKATKDSSNKTGTFFVNVLAGVQS